MRAFVFTDSALVARAGQFVWLALDVEKEVNAPFRERFAVQALPSFFVIDPGDTSVVLRWVGGATAAQMVGVLDEGRAAVAPRATPTVLARADRLYGEGKNAEAAELYAEALAAAPDDWPSYGRTTESLLFALQAAGRPRDCALAARQAFRKLRRGPSAVNVAAYGLDCALGVEPGDSLRAELVSALEGYAREVAADHSVPASADDRSGLLATLMSARQQAGDSLGARQAAERWAAFLDAEAARAATPEERTVFDSHRLSAYLELGRPEAAIPFLEQSQREFPRDYNPPARLALTYRVMKEWDRSIAAADRALALAYGPRKLGIYLTKVDALVGKGDHAGARAVIEEALAYGRALPEAQRSKSRESALEKKLAELP